MMIEKEYITVSEYAEIKGISQQAVYKQLKNKLKPFLIMVENKKCLKIEVLNQVEKQNLNQVKQPKEQPFNNQIQPVLMAELEEKNKIIESLLRQVESLTEQNGKLTELLHNSQYLLAAEQKHSLSIEQETTAHAPVETEEETKPKKGLFSLFKRTRK